MDFHVTLYEIGESSPGNPRPKPAKIDSFMINSSTIDGSKRELLKKLRAEGKKVRLISFTREDDDDIGLAAIVFEQASKQAEV